VVTHAHRDAVDGAIAVALAAAWAAKGHPGRDALLHEVARAVRPGPIADVLSHAATVPGGSSPEDAGAALGTGFDATAPDTVPFAHWSAAHHLDSFGECFWATVAGLGDRDTTCAIACGVVAAAGGREDIPSDWAEAVELIPLTAPS
jgi:ADP-ribosylglycohydrolase